MSVRNFSVILPWRGGKPIREALLTNLLNCLKVQDHGNHSAQVGFELIIVEQVTEESAEQAQATVKELVPQELAPYTYIGLKTKSPHFNKSWCMNVGARTAKYNDLIFMDADSLFGADYLKTIDHQVNGTPTTHSKIMVAWNYLIGLPGKDNPISRHLRPDMLRTLGGIWYANKDFYFGKFGGMNENFEGYGGEDNEAYERACSILGLSNLSYIGYPIAHQYHDWEPQHSWAVPGFELGRKYPIEVTARLIQANVGKRERPTFINLEDLK